MPKTRWKSCSRKMRHTTEATAQAHLDRLISVGAARGSLHVYECKCGGWHVGHKIGLGGRRK